MCGRRKNAGMLGGNEWMDGEEVAHDEGCQSGIPAPCWCCGSFDVTLDHTASGRGYRCGAFLLHSASSTIG